ncbi:Lunapark domain [Arabidopsis suecica]|uniref:Lunapark domain n=1 Tax=Arabidopsis suecica TaxID=45249 RepID=A0A8T2AD46_ARASU|nr:Lunapark domain [Arabidopsis suecica]
MAVGEKEHEGTVVESGGEKNDSAVVLSASGEKKTTKRKGLFSRIWNAIFRVRGDDFEKRLKNISKEEATVRNRMKRRSITRRNFIRNLIAFSIFFEVIAVSYAIMTTRDEDLDWKLRSFRILPMFLLPVVAFLLYSSLVGFWRMCDRRDQHTLEKLQAEMLGKINELKERTNYYITQQLIQRYDPDPAAKAAAATVLASKLGAESGLKVYVGDESQLDPTPGKSNDMEVKHSRGLRNRRQPNTKHNSAGTTPTHHSDNESNHSGTSERITGIEQNQQMVFEHFNPHGYAAHDGTWISRIAALLVGEDPTQSYALICGNCRMHNGLARKEDFLYTTYYCPHCRALNKPKHSEEHSLIAPADTLHAVSLKPMEREVINSNSLTTSERGNSPIPLLKTQEIVEEVPETAESETPN